MSPSFELLHFKDIHNTSFFSKMFRAEVRDKQVHYMVADDYGILWIIALEQLKLTW